MMVGMALSTKRQSGGWRIDTTPGKTYGELTVVREVEPRTYPSGQKRRQIEVECKNGHRDVVEPSILRERPVCRKCVPAGRYVPTTAPDRDDRERTPLLPIQAATDVPHSPNGGGFDYRQMFQLLTTLERLEATDRDVYKEIIMDRASRIRKEVGSR